MKRKCLYCGTLLNGRTDKKFCDDGCRNTYNNSVRLNDEKYLSQINYILRKNWKILKQFYKSRYNTVEVISLVCEGFAFEYHTHGRICDGKAYFFCYEIGYSFLNADKVEVIRDRLSSIDFVPSELS